jgi:hypothetical protein
MTPSAQSRCEETEAVSDGHSKRSGKGNQCQMELDRDRRGSGGFNADSPGTNC